MVDNFSCHTTWLAWPPYPGALNAVKFYEVDAATAERRLLARHVHPSVAQADLVKRLRQSLTVASGRRYIPLSFETLR
jgi:hypothetical protein